MPGAPPTPTNVEELESVASEQRGLVTRAQCRAAGVTDTAIESGLSRGRWVRVQRGVYLTSPGRDDWWMWALAAHLARGPQAAWSHATAGYAFGLVTRPPRRVELIVPDGAEAVAPVGAVVRRSRRLDERVDPMRWPWRTMVEETVLDLAASGSVDDVLAMLGRAFQQSLTTEEVLRRRLSARARHPRRELLPV
jgi:predicted transcriptional regulator of viral defense system